MGIGSLMKIARGGALGPDEMTALFEAMGMDVSMREVERNHYSAAFTETAQAASLPSSKMVVIQGADKSGQGIEALIIVAPVREKVA